MVVQRNMNIVQKWLQIYIMKNGKPVDSENQRNLAQGEFEKYNSMVDNFNAFYS